MTKTLDLLHVSIQFDHNIDLFVPRIPALRADFEDDFLERICASNSIRGCFLGHPHAIDDFCEDYSEGTNRGPLSNLSKNNSVGRSNDERFVKSPLYHLPKINEIGRVYKVYHFEVPEEEVMTPKELLSMDFVPDAYASHEHWILNPTVPAKIEYILLRGIDSPVGSFDEVYLDVKFDYISITESDLEGIEIIAHL